MQLVLLAHRKGAELGARGSTHGRLTAPAVLSFHSPIRGSYFSALLCALERSGCEDAFEQKETKLTMGYESSGCGVSGRKHAEQMLGGFGDVHGSKLEAAEARRPPFRFIDP